MYFFTYLPLEAIKINVHSNQAQADMSVIILLGRWGVLGLVLSLPPGLSVPIFQTLIKQFLKVFKVLVVYRKHFRVISRFYFF